jgi:hypothetical protein
MSSDRTKAILGALSDKCTCVYVENENGDPELLMYECAQCHAADWIEALEGEVERLKVQREDAAKMYSLLSEKFREAEERAERLRVALTDIWNLSGDLYATETARKALEDDKQ